MLHRVAAKGPSVIRSSLSGRVRRLLAVKVHGMGDSVLVRSILEQLRSRHPTMDIGVLAGAGTRDILTLNSDFRVHLYSQKDLSAGSALAALLSIRRCRYDAVLNFEQGSLAGTAFIAAARIPFHAGFVSPGHEMKTRLLSHPLRFDQNHTMWESFLTLARLIDPGLSASITFPIHCRPQTEAWMDQWLATRGLGNDQPVAFHLGSAPAMDYRRWPLERFARLAEELRAAISFECVVLTGTAVEKDLIARFMREYRGRCIDASELGSIERTIALLRRCQLMVSNDTGIMHLAAAVGVPTVGLFGPNTPRHWAPVGPRAAYVYETSAPCSPCINNYTNDTPRTCINPVRGRCMRDISVSSVVTAASRVVFG